MTLCTADFESGINGNTISTGDTGSATAWDNVVIDVGADAITYDTAHPANGSLSAKFVTDGGGATYLYWSAAFFPVTDHYGRLYMYCTANPIGAQSVFLLISNATSRCARFDINTDGTLRFFDNPITGVITTTNSIALNQLIRVEWHVVHSETVGQIELKLFNNASSSTPTETITSPANWNTLASGTEILFGFPTSGPAYTYWVDEIIAGAASYPGPVGVPTLIRTPKRLVGPTLVTNSPATVYTVPATYITRMRHVHISNPSGSPVDMTLSIGTDAVATRLLDGKPIAADSVYEMACDEVLAAGEIVQISASSTNVLTVTISGEEWVPA